MARIVIIHGNGGGSGEDHWQPWLKAELEKLEHEVLTPTMPDNIEAKALVWLSYMKAQLSIDENTIIVGHSSGAVAAMRYAENSRVKGTILLGACYTDLNDEIEKLSGYYNEPWQWDVIAGNQEFVVVMASKDDPWIDISEPRHIFQSLNCEYHEYTNKGHFTEEHMGNKKFPELLQIITNHLK